MITATSLSPLGQFCADYLAVGTAVASWGKVFLIVALAAGAVLAAVEAWKRFSAPSPAAAARVGAAGIPVKDLVDALRDVVTALATAPVWLALLAVGLLVFWVPGAAVPAKCEEADTYAAWPAPPPAPMP